MRLDPDTVSSAMDRCGARVAAPGSPEYPPGLEELADPPVALFIRGRSPVGLEPRVAVVGARRPTPLGREVARALGRELGSAGVCVVSGAALGIDAESHQGALDAGGMTLAVLGSGVDQPYPPRNRRLIERIADIGAVVSEYPPGVAAEPFRFPARNRIVAGLSKAIVVVEGAAGSGSLITAEHALDIGRAVFAVPGPVTSQLSEAPLALIRDGATLVRSADDVLSDLGLALAASGADGGVGGPPGADSLAPPGLTQAEQEALTLLTGPLLPDQLARSMGCSIARMVPVLLQLELRGLVRNVGGRYERRLA
jgi:DNA processing protein